MTYLIGEDMWGGYGGADILQGCSIGVEKGEIAVVVGPNGAGKSTTMKAIFGMLNLRKGSVRIGGEEITGLKPEQRVLKGMGFVPQTNNIFTSMTVEENLEMGAFIRRDDFADTMTQVFDLFYSEGKAKAACGRAFRRTAPAGGCGARAHDPA